MSPNDFFSVDQRHNNRQKLSELKTRMYTSKEMGKSDDISEEDDPNGQLRRAQTTVLESRRAWVLEQRALADKLSLTRVSKYLGRVCDVCGRPAPKHSRLDLCKEHAERYQRDRHRKNQKRYRERQ